MADRGAFRLGKVIDLEARPIGDIGGPSGYSRRQGATDDLADLEQEILDEVPEIDEKWRVVAGAVEPVAIRLEATDVRVTDVRLVWVPVD